MANQTLGRVGKWDHSASIKRVVGWLHKQTWQRFPRQFRRRCLFWAAAKLAPHPDGKPCQPSGPIYVVGPLRTASGLGASARLSLAALRQAGYDAWGIDLSLKHDPKLQDFDFAEAADAMGPGTIILHINGFLTPLALFRLGAKRLRQKMVVGYWAWELSELPDEWLPGFSFVHEIWVPSRFVADAVARRTRLPVRVLLHPVQCTNSGPQFNASPKETTNVFVTFDMASSFVRKNPLAAIAAFRAAFQDDPAWQLIVKVSDGDSFPKGRDALREATGSASNIALIEGILGAEDMAALLASADIILSLHRSEGFGLVLAEAMRLGKVVVATNWSGNIDFMTPENSCPVGYRLVPAHDPQNTYEHPNMLWAEPDLTNAIHFLKTLRDRNRREQLGRQAQSDASNLFSAERYGSLVADYLGIPPLYPGNAEGSSGAPIF